jgi:hypothetical protein
MRRGTALIAGIIVVGGALGSAAASATTITFSGLTGANGAPVATYTEGGFTVATTLGEFFQGQAFGNPIPSLFAGPAQGGPANDTLDVTKTGGGSFSFASVDLAANNGNVNFTFTGSLGGIQQYVFSGVEPGRPPGPFGFDTIINPDAGIAIDDAMIALDVLGTTGNIDNIIVNPVATPEPAGILLLGGALIGLGAWCRRKSKAITWAWRTARG